MNGYPTCEVPLLQGYHLASLPGRSDTYHRGINPTFLHNIAIGYILSHSIPLATGTDFQISRISFTSMEMGISYNNHLSKDFPYKMLEDAVMHISGVTVPSCNQTPLIQKETQFATYDPAVVGNPLLSDLFWATHSRLELIKEAAYSIERYWYGVVNFVKSKITNGILEGINSLVQAARNKARGYRSAEYFITLIYTIAGKLEFGLPT